MAELSTTWVREAHGDAWQTLAVTTEELPGVRLSATGLPHPQWNNGDVDDPAAVDIETVKHWYDALDVPWGMRVPEGAQWRHGRHLFTKRLMGVTPDGFAAVGDLPGVVVRPATADDLEAALVVDTVAFDESAEVERPWLQLLMAHPAVTVAVAELGGEIVGTGSVTMCDGRAGRSGYVAGIGVLPQVRRRGIGASLSSWLTRAAINGGATLCHLHPDTDAAAAIYGRLGYVEVGGLDIYVDM
ncbi:MAG TPA: GNAT family N-acetyltransferase [Mycobacteriales bacterium]|nr:GNAT family N-acetyltransferase [Mycobacteriales bacterium]